MPLAMASALFGETSFANISSPQDSNHPDDHFQVVTLELKPFSYFVVILPRQNFLQMKLTLPPVASQLLIPTVGFL